MGSLLHGVDSVVNCRQAGRIACRPGPSRPVGLLPVGFGWHGCCTSLLYFSRLPDPADEAAVQGAGRCPGHVLGRLDEGGPEVEGQRHRRVGVLGAQFLLAGRARPGSVASAAVPDRQHRAVAGHRPPPPGQWPRGIGSRCRAWQGRSAPHRQMCRHRRQHHIGRCRRARVRAVADRYSSYDTCRFDDKALPPEAGCCGTPRVRPDNRRRAASRSHAWRRSPTTPETADGDDGKFRPMTRRKSPILTVMWPTLRRQDAEGTC